MLVDIDAAIEAVVAEIRSGRMVVIPTDTVYGIAASATDREAVASIFEVKQRPFERRMAILVADPDQAEALVETDDTFAALAARFWPGPLTLVASRRAESGVVVGDASSLGVRCPAHRLVTELARRLGPLATTSANIHGEVVPTDAASVAALLPTIGLVIDGGPCAGRASTVVDVRGPRTVVLRQGPISEAEIVEALGSRA